VLAPAPPVKETLRAPKSVRTSSIAVDVKIAIHNQDAGSAGIRSQRTLPGMYSVTEV